MKVRRGFVIVNSIGTQLIETDRLILRRFMYSDLDDMLEHWISLTEVQKNYGEPVYTTIDETMNLLDKWISSYDKEDFYRWAIISKESGLNIGQIAFYKVNSKNQYVDVEYCIGKEYWGNGYATEALKGVINFVFNKMNFNRVQAFHRSKNITSGRVLEKAGMKYEGRLKQYVLHNGVFDDCIMYAILKEEWKQENCS